VRRKSDGAVLGNYSYDGLSRRTTQSVGGTTTHTYYSDAWRPLEERRDSQTTAARQYYWGARHRDDLVRRDRATTSGGPLNETRYVLMDYFSPAALTDETGVVKERYAFSAFGVRRILTPTFGDRATSECDFTFGFQGQFVDTESGFLNYGYRYYSPHLGRWLCKDPAQDRGENNYYAFVKNMPTQYTDRFGLQIGMEYQDLSSPLHDPKNWHPDNLGWPTEEIADPGPSCFDPGWLKHCVNSCRAQLRSGSEKLTMFMAQMQGHDLPWEKSRMESDVDANKQGIDNAKANGARSSCIESCRPQFFDKRLNECCLAELVYKKDTPECCKAGLRKGV